MRASDYPHNLVREIYPALEETRAYPPDFMQVIEYILAGLDERERRVLQHRLQYGESLAQVSRTFGVTRSRIQQIEQTALQKLQKAENIELLKLGVFGYARKFGQAAYENAKKVIRKEVETLVERHNKEVISSVEENNAVTMRIDDMPLSYRSKHWLKKAGMETAFDIAKMTRNEFMNIRKLGDISRAEIISVLESKHFNCDHLKSRKRGKKEKNK